MTYDDAARLAPIRETDEYLLREQEIKERATDFDLLCYVLAMIFYLVNVGSDIALALKYLSNESYIFFSLTLVFVLLPAITMTVFSCILYRLDVKILQKKTSAGMWCCRVLCHLCLAAPLAR